MFGSDCLVPSKPRSSRRQLQTPQSDPLKCPRCKSTNTKFCYYNNYNKTQPRHFCKACKRHWTKGGILRNVPVGGGQKNKRFRRPNNATSTATATITVGPMVIRKNPNEDHDVILGISDSKDISYDTAKTTLFKSTDDERRDDVESYTNIEELKSLVSWDLYGSFSACTMQQLPLQDHQILGFSKLSSSFETNPSSTTSRLFIEKLENVEDSTSTTSMIMPSYQQWQVPNTSNFSELDNWKWNDLDTMILADIKKPWEDPQFKT